MKEGKTINDIEIQSNVYVAQVMRITMLMVLVAYGLNIVGVFEINKAVMNFSAITSLIILVIPTILIHVIKWQNKFTKYIFLICAVIFVAIFTFVLSYHAIIFFVYSIVLSSIYLDKKVSDFTIFLSVNTLILAQILCFNMEVFPDGNFKSLEEFIKFAVIPRTLALIAISIIISTLSNRTSKIVRSLASADEQKAILDRMMEIKDKTNEVSEHLVDSVDKLADFTSKTKVKNKNVLDITEETVDSSEEMFSNIQETTKSISDIEISINTLVNQSDNVNKLSRDVGQLIEVNVSDIAEVMEDMKKISVSSEEGVNIINTLEEKSEHIINIIEVITGISNQTDLLALNAGIEAARAGEHGKGFNIVAQEIGSLARMTQESIEDIRAIVNEVTGFTKAAVSIMEQSSSLVASGLESIKKAEESSTRITNAGISMKNNLEIMDKVANEIANANEKIISSINEIKETSEKNLEGSKKISDVSIEESEELNNLYSMVENIDKLASDLKILVNN